MAFESKASGIAASVYIALYTIYISVAVYILSQVGFRTKYNALTIYGIFRFAGQLCAIVFAVLGYNHWQWLVAYLVFTAEGYFMLILTSFYLLGQAQHDTTGKSWIDPNKQERNEAKARAITSVQRFRATFSIAIIFHFILIPANVLIIYGGTQLAGLSIEQISDQSSKVRRSKIFRTAGQSVFLAQSIIAIGLALYCLIVEKLRHINIYTILFVAPFLTVRGIFGILSIYIQKMNYYDFSNYTADGLSSSFVTYEYVLATTMEFIVAVSYLANYFLRKKKYPQVHLTQKDNDEELKSLNDKQSA
ncbi:hypothetical protein DFJ63DRAFT_311233 [Scheffersomyces coipomensis]|uniref:uncharacterized protein n=1 Tax=Scheffersomyces coipomensis TaxID=1788519 RepID=UPI00315D0AE6